MLTDLKAAPDLDFSGLTEEAFAQMNAGHTAGAAGEPLPDDAAGSFLVGWLAGAHGEGWINADQVAELVRERGDKAAAKP